jgi:excisionase family DNA binding protein
MGDTIRWLTTQDAAERACCDAREVRRAVRRGHLRAARIRGGELRFLESSVDEWLLDQLLPEDNDSDLAVDATSLRRELSLW